MSITEKHNRLKIKHNLSRPTSIVDTYSLKLLTHCKCQNRHLLLRSLQLYLGGAGVRGVSDPPAAVTPRSLMPKDQMTPAALE